MIKKLLDSKAILLAGIISLVITTFLGCFFNGSSGIEQKIDGKSWQYINRGYPKPWAGVHLTNSNVELPLMKMPFAILADDRGTKLQKIINLENALPVWIVAFILTYAPSYIFSKATQENKKLTPFLYATFVLAILIEGFVYFAWFSRV